jgi:hypothetical protein
MKRAWVAVASNMEDVGEALTVAPVAIDQQLAWQEMLV